MSDRIDAGFWAGKKVFVTGTSGFKGAWLRLMLERLGSEVTAFTLPPPTDPALDAMTGAGRTGRTIIGDITDAAALAQAVQESAPEIVLHLAAQALVRDSYREPIATYAANLMGTVNLLEACRLTPGVRTIVSITTDKVYENRGLTTGYAEDDRLGGHDPYSNSKACAELAIACYRDSFFRAAGVGLASARAGNVVGGGDFARDRIVPDAVRAFSAGVPLRIRNPLAVRPWQHVLDPLGGYLVLAQALHADPAGVAGGWNLGPSPDESHSVQQVADRLAALWGGDASWMLEGGEHPHEAKLLTLDPAKAARELGWHQVLDLEETLRMTVDWYRCWADGGDVTALTRRQCDAFLGLG